MKNLLKYMLGLTLLAGMLFGIGGSVYYQDANGSVKEEYIAALGEIQELHEQAIGCDLELPDDMVLPQNKTLASFSQKYQFSIKYTGSTVQRRYLTQKTSRDYLEDYRTLLNRQEHLPPIFKPALEYVFMLRQIVI